jgi:RecA-family ATPase
MLINATMRIKEGLKCAAGYDHHVSKEVMRNGIVDHHAGRGGAALGDGARAVYSLLTITKELAPNYPGTSLFQDDIAAGRLLAYQITKLTDAPKPLEPLILRRNGWLFEPVKLPEPVEIERAIIDARCERARQNLDKLVAYLKEHRYTKPSRKNLEDVHRDVGMSRDDLRAAITQGLMTATLIERSLPADEQKGARKTYLAIEGAG